MKIRKYNARTRKTKMKRKEKTTTTTSRAREAEQQLAANYYGFDGFPESMSSSSSKTSGRKEPNVKIWTWKGKEKIPNSEKENRMQL